ncbi:hypothetical protein ACFX1R_006216 [Malus domestica]
MNGHFFVKSDVCNFSVFVLETVSRQKNNCFHHEENIEDLLSYAWKWWCEGTSSNLIDPTLSNGSRNEILRCIHIGLPYVQENIANRPTMNAIVLMLNSYSVTLPVPSQLAFFRHGSVGSDMSLGWNISSEVMTTESDRLRAALSKHQKIRFHLITEVNYILPPVTLSVSSKPAFHMQNNGEPDISTMTDSDESKNLPILVSKNEPSNITEPYPR